MANELQTRIQLKHDKKANWDGKDNFIPLLGEMIIYEEDSDTKYPRFKIGDGEKTVNELPFATAKEIEAAINNALTTGGAIYNSIEAAKSAAVTQAVNQAKTDITINTLGGIKGTWGNQTIDQKGKLPEGEFYFYYKD